MSTNSGQAAGVPAGRCESCGTISFPPPLLCPSCGARVRSTAELRGGTLLGVTSVHPREGSETFSLALVETEQQAGKLVARLLAPRQPGEPVALRMRGGRIEAEAPSG